MESKTDELGNRIRALYEQEPTKLTSTAPGVAQKTTEVEIAKIKVIIITTATPLQTRFQRKIKWLGGGEVRSFGRDAATKIAHRPTNITRTRLIHVKYIFRSGEGG